MRQYVVQGRVATDYSTLYYEELGEGDPVILVHDHSLSNLMWEQQFYTLSQKYRMIRYDLRGYGESSSQIEYVHFTHAEDLIALMNALSLEKAHLVGLGMGGSIATDMLAMYPERVSSAVLASGNLEKIPGPSQPVLPAGSSKKDLKTVKQKETDKDKIRQKRLNEILKTAGSQRENIREPLSAMIQAWDVWQAFHKEARILGGLDTYETLKEKRPQIPVLIVEGKAKGNAYSHTTEILNILPLSKFILLEDCGRLLNIEQPEAFNQIVLDFIDSTAPL
ncbi:alpha/beta hydrolase [Bacteroides sp. 51]|nr:alpha/beta hydrolase [Bacteroides sp. 51]